MSKWCFIFLILLLCLVGNLPAQHITRGPYLQMNLPNSIVIRWRTDIPMPTQASYGPSISQMDHTEVDTALKTEHSVFFSGLQPSNRYYYLIGDASSPLAGPDDNHYFKAAPLPGEIQPYRIWAFGDFGRGNLIQKQVRDAYINESKQEEADVWLWLGDNAYENGSDSDYQNHVFDTVDGYQSIMTHLPFWPCPGNHDYHSCNHSGPPPTHTGPYYDIIEVPTAGEAGGEASGMEAYYSFDYGNIHFVSFNSEANPWNFSDTSQMALWLDTDLENTQQKWKIVYFHQPPYSAGSHNSDHDWESTMKAMREEFTPIFDKRDVDLVLAGHSHVYERSYPIRNHTGKSGSFNPSYHLVQPTSGYLSEDQAYSKFWNGSQIGQGTIYAVIGTGGSSKQTPALDHPAMFFGYGCDTCVGSLILDIHGDTLKSHFLTSNGNFLDEFTIFKTNLPPEPDPGSSGLLEIFPNPANEEINLNLNLINPAEARLEVINSIGKTILEFYRGWLQAGTNHFDLTETLGKISPGVYWVRLTCNGETTIKKLVKLR